MAVSPIERLNSQEFLGEVQSRLRESKASDVTPRIEDIQTIIEIFEPFLLKLLRENVDVSIEEITAGIIGYFWGTKHFTDENFLQTASDNLYGRDIELNFGELNLVNHLIASTQNIRE